MYTYTHTYNDSHNYSHLIDCTYVQKGVRPATKHHTHIHTRHSHILTHKHAHRVG